MATTKWYHSYQSQKYVGRLFDYKKEYERDKLQLLNKPNCIDILNLIVPKAMNFKTKIHKVILKRLSYLKIDQKM